MDALSLLPSGQEMGLQSRSRLVIVAAQRARQIMQGALPALPTKHAKPTTIGSKVGDLAVTQEILAVKAELEKIREQVQNVE